MHVRDTCYHPRAVRGVPRCPRCRVRPRRCTGLLVTQTCLGENVTTRLWWLQCVACGLRAAGRGMVRALRTAEEAIGRTMAAEDFVLEVERDSFSETAEAFPVADDEVIRVRWDDERGAQAKTAAEWLVQARPGVLCCSEW